MSARDQTPAAARPAGAGACALLGAVIATVGVLLPDAVLLPALDPTAPRVVGVVATCLALAAGWWWGARLSTVRGILGAGAVALAGGVLAGRVVPGLNPRLDTFLQTGAANLYFPAIALACGLAAAPLGSSLGILAAAIPERRSTGAFLAGAGFGFLAAPFVGEILLGRPATLMVCGLLGASVALLLAETKTAPAARRLASGSGPALVTGGLLLGGAWRALSVTVELGTAGVPWLLAAVCLAGAVGSTLAKVRWLDLALGALAAVSAWAFRAVPLVTAPGGHPVLRDVAALLVVGVPAGLLLGGLLASRGRGIRLASAPLLLAGSAAIVPLLSAQLDLRSCALVAASLPLLARLRRREAPTAGAWVAVAAVAALALVSVPGTAQGLQPARAWWRPQGHLSQVTDPTTGRSLLAVDGRAPLGRSLLQARRLIHLPLLLHPGPVTRVLVVATDTGEAARAALEHDWVDPMDPAHQPPFVWWLTPLAYPDDLELEPFPPNLFRESATERQFLTAHPEPYDVIVLAPDPRVASRAMLVGTVEWFEHVRQRLPRSGLLCQWFDLSAIDVTDLKRILASAHSVFEHTWVLLDHPRARHSCLALLGSSKPLRLSPAAMDLRLRRQPAVGADMRAVGLDGLMIACLISADRGTLELIAPIENALNDDRPELGARSALRSLPAPATLRNGRAAFMARRHVPLQWIDAATPADADVRAHVRDIYHGFQPLFDSSWRAIEAMGAGVAAFDREAPGEGPEVEADGFIEALLSLPDWEYLQAQVLGHAARLEREGRSGEAEHYLYRAVEQDPSSARLRFALASLVDRGGDAARAAELYETVLAFDPDHAQAQAALAALQSRLQQPAGEDGAGS